MFPPADKNEDSKWTGIMGHSIGRIRKRKTDASCTEACAFTKEERRSYTARCVESDCHGRRRRSTFNESEHEEMVRMRRSALDEEKVVRRKRSDTLLNLERTVTCEDWGDTAKYWKWDHVVPDSCWRKYL